MTVRIHVPMQTNLTLLTQEMCEVLLPEFNIWRNLKDICAGGCGVVWCGA